MLEKIEIQGLRGIERGLLSGLSPLTILVGKNGMGKSTILDAMLIATSPVVGDAVGRAVFRRSLAHHSAQDFFHFFQAKGQPAMIRTEGDTARTCCLSWEEEPAPMLLDRLEYQRKARPFSQIKCEVSDPSGAKQTGYTAFSADNSYVYSHEGAATMPATRVRLIETTQPMPWDRLYSELVQQGKRQRMKKILLGLIPGFADIELLTSQNNKPALYIIDSNDQAVNLGLIGDGLVGFVRLALTLLTRDEDLILIEEPEVHQHPALIEKSAEIILESVRSGKQVVATTHSLEFIDALIHAAQTEDLSKMAVIKLAIEDGELLSGITAGEHLKFERQVISEDMR